MPTTVTEPQPLTLPPDLLGIIESTFLSSRANSRARHIAAKILAGEPLIPEYGHNIRLREESGRMRTPTADDERANPADPLDVLTVLVIASLQDRVDYPHRRMAVAELTAATGIGSAEEAFGNLARMMGHRPRTTCGGCNRSMTVSAMCQDCMEDYRTRLNR